MAIAPDHITITVDETALREQVQKVIQTELHQASFALRRAADALDPEFMTRHNEWMHEQWERERRLAAPVSPPQEGNNHATQP